MNVNVFFDANVLVYAAVGSGKDARKKERGLELIEKEDFGASAQVLQEFFVTVVKKASRPLSPAPALEWIEQWAAFPCQAIDHQLVRIAVENSARHEVSYWDAAILAAAQALGAQTVFSEDLNSVRFSRGRGGLPIARDKEHHLGCVASVACATFC